MRALMIEPHRYHGFVCGRDLFCRYLTLGWLTLAISEESLMARLGRLRAVLERAR
ncbi:MAG: hypothetical protein ACU0A2_15325 [Cognatishimia sp.]|uniref:hypothetical protein n=1 Tax=Cognatishimia sp. TaxID=2211648 RepID=UPI004058D82F